MRQQSFISAGSGGGALCCRRQQQAPPRRQRRPEVHVQHQLVVETVSVRDKNGKPVEG